MRRLMLGSLAAGLAMWVARFIFSGPLLGWIPFATATDANAAALRQSMIETLGPTGTGVYAVPSTATTLGTQLHAQGPVAVVQFTNSGFPGFDTTAYLWGLLLAVFCAFAFGLALRAATSNMGFGERVKLVALVAVAIAGYRELGGPVFDHAPWTYFIYQFIAEVLTWLAAGTVLARWFLPVPTVALVD
jgi:hypothetical protein